MQSSIQPNPLSYEPKRSRARQIILVVIALSIGLLWLVQTVRRGTLKADPGGVTMIAYTRPADGEREVLPNAFVSAYLNPGPTRDEIDATPGLNLLEFGTAWCGHCQAAAPAVATVLSQFPSARHIKVEDGPGRRLGRSFGVKLWPTFIVLQDGVEVARSVRPERPDQIRDVLTRTTNP